MNCKCEIKSYLQKQIVVGSAFEEVQHFHVYLQSVIARWISQRQLRLRRIAKSVAKQYQLPFVIFVVKFIAQWRVVIFPAFAPNMELCYQRITSCRRTKASPSLRDFIC